MTTHNCDLCGHSEATLLEVARPYVGDQQVPVVCKGCGFIFIRERRSHTDIIESWKKMYAAKDYDPSWPGVRARLFYVAEWIDQNYGLNGKSLYDLGCGDGWFVSECQERGANAIGSDPAFSSNMSENAVEQYDFVTITWTLENCIDCLAMLREAAWLVKPTGRVIVATGSRILVPPRKPLSSYFSKTPADTHCFRWSSGSLTNAMLKTGFTDFLSNDYDQNDVLLKSGKLGTGIGEFSRIQHDAVLDHFDRWAKNWP